MTFKWLLNGTETLEDLLRDEILSKKQVVDILEAGPEQLDCLYLVKWYNLSYNDATWEQASCIRKQD